jgi:hypothetical protein
MDVKRNHEGQVLQKEAEGKPSDTNLTGAANGADLKLGFTIGKEGQVKKLKMAQTDHTHDLGGPAPLHPFQK